MNECGHNSDRKLIEVQEALFTKLLGERNGSGYAENLHT